MDTKWKRCKGWIGIIAFCLGLGMLFHSLLTGIDQAYVLRETIPTMSEHDYQSTVDFRGFISGRLESFLGMATGGPVDPNDYNSAYYYSYGDTYYTGFAESPYDYETVFETEDKSQLSQPELEAIAEDLGMVAESGQGLGRDELQDILSSYGYNLNEPADDKEAAAYYKKQAEQFHQLIQNDKNLLYIIQYEGKTLYTNAKGTGLSGGSKPSLPEGYNFLLNFDGEKVTIRKDGQEIDVYGDGYYRESSDWFVPGYKNFTVDEKTKNAGVVIAATESPIMYMNGN